MFEYEGFEAFSDLEDESHDDLMHGVIDRFIYIAARNGTSIEHEIESCLKGHRKIKAALAATKLDLRDW